MSLFLSQAQARSLASAVSEKCPCFLSQAVARSLASGVSLEFSAFAGFTQVWRLAAVSAEAAQGLEAQLSKLSAGFHENTSPSPAQLKTFHVP